MCNKENPDKLLQKFSNQIITEDDKRSSSEEIEDQDEEQGEDESSGNGSSELTQNIFTTTPQNPTVRPSNIGHANISNSLLIIMYATTVNILIVKNIFM